MSLFSMESGLRICMDWEQVSTLPLGCLPSVRTFGGGFLRICVDWLSQAAVIFNSKLEAELNNLNSNLPGEGRANTILANSLFLMAAGANDISHLQHVFDYLNSEIGESYKLGAKRVGVLGIEVADRGCRGTGTVEGFRNIPIGSIVMSSTGRKITLKSSDGENFEVDEAVALESQTIKHMIEDDCADNGIPLPNVTSKILCKVIEYCKKHVETPKSDDRSASVDDELKSWDADFVKVDQATLFDLILAANYLNIKSLLDLTCQTVADMIKGKTPEEIRKTFNIKNDFTPEEEEEVRRENQWAFE
ncbi:hypothetical protein CRYUN_Cryun28dG0109800 [Craigia yunnanensis]